MNSVGKILPLFLNGNIGKTWEKHQDFSSHLDSSFTVTSHHNCNFMLAIKNGLLQIIIKAQNLTVSSPLSLTLWWTEVRQSIWSFAPYSFTFCFCWLLIMILPVARVEERWGGGVQNIWIFSPDLQSPRLAFSPRALSNTWGWRLTIACWCLRRLLAGPHWQSPPWLSGACPASQSLWLLPHGWGVISTPPLVAGGLLLSCQVTS